MSSIVVSVVGMAGSGKSVVSRVFEANGFFRVRFGDITEQEIKKRGLLLNEANERLIRELLREEHGMAAYAILNQPYIDRALERSGVVVDGLYSWEEYQFLKTLYGKNFYLVAVWASPDTRYTRLASRQSRALTKYEASSRDRSEIENLNIGGPIAMADFTLSNETTLAQLKLSAQNIVDIIKGTVPFIALHTLTMVLVAYIPALSLWLPSMMR